MKGICATLVVALGCAMAWAQATAQISGTVKDQSGAVLPGVEVTATQTETGIVRTAVTNETGSYVLSNLAARTLSSRSGIAGISDLCADGNRVAGQ